MTTAVPTLDPTAEPLLDEPDRRVCQFWPADPCHRPAVWSVTIAKDCGHPTQQALSCEPCLKSIRRTGVYCTHDNQDARISQVEPL